MTVSHPSRDPRREGSSGASAALTAASQPDSYSEVLPIEGPPSFRGQSVKYVYKLTIGCQRVNSPITLLRVPLRVLVLTGE